MASIYKRKRAKGQYVYLVSFRDIRGDRRRLTAKTKEEAEQLLADKIRESRAHPRRLLIATSRSPRTPMIG